MNSFQIYVPKLGDMFTKVRQRKNWLTMLETAITEAEVDLEVVETPEEGETITGAEAIAEEEDKVNQTPPVTIVEERDILPVNAHWQSNSLRQIKPRRPNQRRRKEKELMEIGERSQRRMKWHPHL